MAKKYRLIIIAAGVLAVAIGIANVKYGPMRDVEQRVKRALSDPDSAEFSDIVFVHATGTGCGYVNAKNKLGGYVGNTMFVATKAGDVQFAPRGNIEASDPSERAAALTKELEFLKYVQASCYTEADIKAAQ